MKLQRYDIQGYDLYAYREELDQDILNHPKGILGINLSDYETPIDADTRWCKSEDVAKLEAEFEKLKADYEKLLKDYF